MPEPRPQVILITGATDGLGRAVATRLAAHAHNTLILHGRDPARLADVRDHLAERPARIHTVRADFSELAQVARLAEDVAELTDHLSVLVNNAGVGFEPRRRLTVDGNEWGFAVNYLAPYLLTQRLVPLLRVGAPARVVNVAAAGQASIDFDDLTLARGYSGARSSGQSKTALIAHGFWLAARLDPSEITVNSLHPATFMPTKIVRESVGYTVDSLETGVASVMRLVEAPELANVTGGYFDRSTPSRALSDAYDPDVQAQLARVSESLTSR
jgi:NAD(P)-dependent dehydrogenase (short-subunit alcohol dehydrogenase family)